MRNRKDDNAPEKIIISILKRYALTLKKGGYPVVAMYLFGSQTKPQTSPESDIDVLVVSPIFDEDRLGKAAGLWKLAQKVDPRIEPIAVGEAAFATDNITPIYEIVRREGVRVI
jgi:predicted nucleotidyltransferase